MSVPEAVVAFPTSFDFEAEITASRAGILEGAVAELPNGTRFPLCFVDLKWIENEFGKSGISGPQFIARPGLFAVSTISRWICTLAVRWADSQDVFCELQPLPCVMRPSVAGNVVLPAGINMAEAQQRGHLEDVVVKLNDNSAHKVSFIDPVRLRKEIEIDAMNGRPFATIPNLILIADVTSDLISDTVRRLAVSGYFSYSKPIKEP